MSGLSHENSSYQSTSTNGLRPRRQVVKKRWYAACHDDKRADVATVLSGTAQLTVGNVNNGVLPPMPRSPPPRNELYNSSGHSVAADLSLIHI